MALALIQRLDVKRTLLIVKAVLNTYSNKTKHGHFCRFPPD
ncbi:hypothetical protein [Marinomonas transparens]|nr:hypothetical protein [Marinomonas transparens]